MLYVIVSIINKESFKGSEKTLDELLTSIFLVSTTILPFN